MNATVIIPCSMESKRLAGKPLCTVNGKTLLEWTVDRAKLTSPKSIVVACDSDEVKDVAMSIGVVDVFKSRWRHVSGTSRCAEAASLFPDDELVINWQVDEPLVPPGFVENLAAKYMGYPSTAIGTLVSWADGVQLEDMDSVKAAVSDDMYCRWFSRAPMAGSMYHVGIYSYPAGVLKSLARLPRTQLADAECLEQLDWLVHGYPIFALQCGILENCVSINTQADLDRFARIIK